MGENKARFYELSLNVPKVWRCCSVRVLKLLDLHLQIVCMWQSCPRQHLSPPQSTSTPNYGSLALYNCILKKCHGQDKLILSLKASHATPAILLLRASFIIIHWKISGTICGPDRYSLNPLMRIIASLNI